MTGAGPTIGAGSGRFFCAPPADGVGCERSVLNTGGSYYWALVLAAWTLIGSDCYDGGQ
jgi:hypothetical protein